MHHKNPLAAAAVIALAGLPIAAHAQAEAPALETVTVNGNWLGTGLETSARTFPGARTLVEREAIENSGAAAIGEVMRRIPGVQVTDNSGTAGSSISLNIGIRGLTGRYSPRSTVLLDGVPLAVAPYGQPQLSFAPTSLENIDSIDVVRGAGAVRYGPQNVGGIVNFKTRAIPQEPGLHGDVSIRRNEYTEGASGNTQAGVFLGTTLDNGLGVALLYSGQRGSMWREASDDDYNDVALKWQYALSGTSEIYGRFSYFDVTSHTPGGLTVAQFEDDPFQNTRPTDYWSGNRKGFDVGYLNTLSGTQELEIRAYYNDSFRKSALINAAGTQLTHQPRNYQVLGVEPRYTQRVALGATTHDVTMGYRYLKETGDDNSYVETVATGATGPIASFDNTTTAHAVYVDDRIAIGSWRVTPGVRFESIESDRVNFAANQAYSTSNDKALPSMSVSYLLDEAATLFANYGTSFGPVQNIQLNSQTADNPLKPELAKTAEIGGRWKDRQLSAEVTLFQIRFDNQILQVPGSNPAVFGNIGQTHHKGIETSIAYAFDRTSFLAGLDVYVNYTYTEATQKSGTTAGNDVPFYSRNTDSVGARYAIGAFAVGVNTTHQSSQYSDLANTVTESANAAVGRIPGYRVWNLAASWKPPVDGLELQAGINNLDDERYYTRNVDGNAGRMVGAPRTVYVQARLGF